MTVGTQPMKKENFHFGNVKVYFIPYTLVNVEETDFIIPEEFYIGAMTDVSLLITRSYKEVYTFIEGLKVLKDSVLISEVVALSISFLETIKRNMDIAFGLNDSSEFLRVEVRSTSELGAILPKVKNTLDSVKLPFINTETPLEIPLNFSVVTPQSAVWTNPSWGKLITKV